MRVRLICALLLLVLPVIVQAQETDDEPLFQILSVIPDSEFTRLPLEGDPLIFSPRVWFGDLHAAYEADPETDPPESYADFQALLETDWRGYQRSGQSGRIGVDFSMPSVIEGIGPERDPVTFGFGGPKVGEVFPEMNGMDYFDLHFAGSFGNPPHRGLIYGGDFDLDSVGSAHTARGYQEYDIHGVRAWCSLALSCDGRNERGENIETFGLFDPRLQSQPPFVGSGNLLASSGDHATLEQIAAAMNDGLSLLDALDFRTLAEAITDPARYSGDLVQAYFMPLGATFHAIDMTTMEPTDDFAGILGDLNSVLAEENVLIPEWSDYGQLPLYELVAVADRAEGEDVVTLLALYYQNEVDAEVAATELARRLASYSGTITYKTNNPLILNRPGNVEFLEPYVYASGETGHFAAVVPIRNDLRYTDEIGGQDIVNNNTVYPVFLNEINSGVFYALWDIRVADWFVEMVDG